MKEAIKVGLGKFGEVDQTVVDKILNLMNESYERLGPPMTNSVDLYVFEKSSLMHSALKEEEEKLGIETSSAGGSFFAVHDAWRNKPRIRLCVDKILEYPEDVSLGGIRHEIGHSILHGSLEFYHIPAEASKVVERHKFPQNYPNTILYLISIAVKDYEVTNLLYRGNFIDDQVAYTKYFLKPSDDDVVSWKVGSGNPLGRILCLVSTFKDVGCALPLTNDKRFGSEIKGCVEKRMSYFPSNYQSKIQRITYETFPLLGSDTMENINLITKAINEEIIGYELK